MSYRGKVSNGTVVLPPEANLPDGTEVSVEPLAPKTLAERLRDVIATVRGGPPDWAENHDHYIHGTLKKSWLCSEKASQKPSRAISISNRPDSRLSSSSGERY